MMINKENYEAYFLDHLEGTLDARGEQELEQFLERNPGLRQEMEGFTMVTLPADDAITFEKKERLKRSAAVISFGRRNYYFAAAAMIAVLITIGGYFNWNGDAGTPVANAPTVATSAKPESMTGSWKEINTPDDEGAVTENIASEAVIAGEVPSLAGRNVIESGENNDMAAPQHDVPQKRDQDMIRSIKPKQVIALENNMNSMEEIKWQEQLLSPEHLWADNGSQNPGLWRTLIVSGAEMGLVPITIAQNYDVDDRGRSKLSNVTINFSIPNNKILDFITK